MMIDLNDGLVTAQGTHFSEFNKISPESLWTIQRPLGDRPNVSLQREPVEMARFKRGHLDTDDGLAQD